MPSIDAKTVIDEIVAAFRDVPRPDRCVPNDYVAYGETDALDYLTGKTWLEVASDVGYMFRHAPQQFYFMTRECLFYLLPGYLLGAITHPAESVAGVIPDLVLLLHWTYFGAGVGEAWELHAYICDRLTVDQKRAVTHWLELMLERDRERSPELYMTGAPPTRLLQAFNGWRHWA